MFDRKIHRAILLLAVPRSVEVGLKRIRPEGFYRLKLAVDEAAAQGPDALSAEAAHVAEQIVKRPTGSRICHEHQNIEA